MREKKKKEKKKCNVNVRLTEEDMDRIKANANDMDMSVSDYARYCLSKGGCEGIHPSQTNRMYEDAKEVKRALIRTFKIIQKCSDQFPNIRAYLEEIEKEYIKIWDM